MLIAIWVLVIFTGVLAAATGSYEYTAYKPNKSSEKQTKAVGKLTEAILRPRSIVEHLQVAGEDHRRKRERTDTNPTKGSNG